MRYDGVFLTMPAGATTLRSGDLEFCHGRTKWKIRERIYRPDLLGERINAACIRFFFVVGVSFVGLYIERVGRVAPFCGPS